MSKRLKRLAMPNTWPLSRKGSKYVTIPNPGPHSMKRGLALNSIITEVLNWANTAKEAKTVLNSGYISIDGKVRKDPKFSAGLMDVMKNNKTGEIYRVLLNKKGKICLSPISENEASIKPCKIIRKQMFSGNRIQITLHDGKNILTDKKDYNVGDTLIIKIPEVQIMKHLKIEKNSFVMITEGKHTGDYGIIQVIVGEQSIEPTKIILKTNDKEYETLKEYAFVIGEGKNSEIAIKQE
ncbi:MAG: 30S ribosomal protein S4e [Candidatus Woesearchaeota archaeon]|nr:30S ribosomal protein S4e [Candidatus Woesearchaeota archaeon]